MLSVISSSICEVVYQVYVWHLVCDIRLPNDVKDHHTSASMM